MREKSEYAGRILTIKPGIGEKSGQNIGHQHFYCEDWAENVFGKSWMFMDGNPTAMLYGIRAGLEGLPTDNEVLYGKVGLFATLVHVSELVLDG